VVTVSSEAVAWAAGLFDGEGTILLSGNKVTAQMSMTDFDLLERMRSYFGGSIYTIAKRKVHWKDAWVWRCGSTPDSMMFLESIYPWLGSRRQAKVEEARIRYHNLRSVRERRTKDLLFSIKDSGITQQQMADAIGCSRKTVNRLLKSW
jgi:hypothetical protein